MVNFVFLVKVKIYLVTIIGLKRQLGQFMILQREDL